MFQTPWKRGLNWVIVILLGGWSLLGAWYGNPDHEACQPSPEQLQELNSLSADRYDHWLTTFYDNLETVRKPAQVLIVQSVSNEGPMVLATSQESSEATSGAPWRAPWPAVIEAMTDSVPAATSVSGNYAGLDYVHHLIPFDLAGKRCLLINHVQFKTSGWSFRSAAGMIALLLGATLIISSRIE